MCRVVLLLLMKLPLLMIAVGKQLPVSLEAPRGSSTKQIRIAAKEQLDRGHVYLMQGYMINFVKFVDILLLNTYTTL